MTQALPPENLPGSANPSTDGVPSSAVAAAAPTVLEADRASVLAWVDAWGEQVAAARMTEARDRFDPAVSGFGTHSDVLRGLDDLFTNQWSRVWPTIEDFVFHTHDADVLVSGDRCQAVAVLGWGSTGIHADGSTFDRPGRATLVLVRDDIDTPWRGIHTHFSLARGVPSTSHGPRATGDTASS
jgi:ketosteroid isomerase-like protein